MAQSERQELATLRKELQKSDTARLGPVVSDAAGRMQEAAGTAGAAARQQIEALADQVRDHPLAALATAGAVGYLLGRLTR